MRSTKKKGATLSSTVPGGTRIFIEIFSGSGRLADKIREMYRAIVVIEIDILDEGGRRDSFNKNTNREVMELARHPDCLGVWFGFPRGTFSVARRYDGGPRQGRGGQRIISAYARDGVRAVLLRPAGRQRWCCKGVTRLAGSQPPFGAY